MTTGGNRDLSLITLVREIIREELREIHTQMPGEVVSYDAEKKTAEIKPHFAFLTPGGVAQPIANLLEVPVKFPQAHGFIIEWPLVAGDLVEISFSEQSIETWAQDSGGKGVDPISNRRHSLSDATCTPCFNVGGQKAATDPLDKEHRDVRIARLDSGNECAIKLKPSGVIVLEGTLVKHISESAANTPVPQVPLKNWLMVLTESLAQLATWLSAAKVGGTPFDGPLPANLTQWSTDIQKLWSDFESGYHVVCSLLKIP